MSPLVWMKYGLLSAVMFLAACAQKPYQLDYSPDATYSSLKTFSLLAPRGETESIQSLNDTRVQSSIVRGLEAQGFRRVEENPDFQVAWRFLRESELQRRGGLSLGFGLGLGTSSRSSVGVGVGSQPPVQEVERQKLVLEMVRPEPRQIFWSAVARDPLSLKAEPAERNQEIDALVRAMLRDFPPGG